MPANRAIVLALLWWCGQVHPQTGSPGQSIQEGLRRQEERARSQQRPQDAGPGELNPARPQAPQPTFLLEARCFTIHEISLAGQDAARFRWLADAALPYLRRCVGVQGLSDIASRLDRALRDAGYATTRVALPPQSLEAGQLQLNVQAGRVDSIRMVDASGKPRDPDQRWGTWRNAFPVSAGDILNVRDLEQGVENMNRLPGQNVSTRLEPGEDANGSVVVIERKGGAFSDRLRGGVTLDNAGSPSLGRAQLSASLALDNPAGLNDIVSASLSTNAKQPASTSRSQSLSVSYSVPWGYNLLSLNASHSRFAQYVQGTTVRFLSSGQSDSAGIRAQRTVWRGASARLDAYAALSTRQSQSYLDDVEIIVQRRHTSNLETGISWRQLLESATVDADLAYRRGVPWRDAQDDLASAATGGLTLRPRIWLFNASVTGDMKLGGRPVQYNAALRMQQTSDATLSLDQFAIGGRSSVRGFDGGAVNVSDAQQVYNQAGTIYSATDLSLTTGALDTTGGTIGAGGRLTLQTGELEAAGAKVTANGDIAVTASTSADLGSSTWSARENFTVASGGNLNATGARLLAEGSLTLQGSGIATANAEIAAHNLSLDAKSGVLNNAAGKLQATGSLNAVAQGINNAGGTIAANGEVMVNAGTAALHNEGGLLYSTQGHASIAAGPLYNNGGVLAAAGALTVGGGPLHNTEGVISGAHAASISVRGLYNDAGVIEAGAGGLTLNTQGQALRNVASGNARGIVSSGDISITAGEVINTSVPGGTGGAGYIGAGGALTVTANGNITNTAGAVITAAAASIDAGGDVTNAGLINSAEGATAITAAALRNTGRIYGDSVAIIAPVYNGADAAGAGAVIASRSGNISIDGPVSNAAGSLIMSLNDLSVTGAVANQGATLSASRHLTIGGALANTNAALSLTSLTRHDATGGFYIQPAGSTATWRPDELLYVSRDSGFWVLPGNVYPLAQFGGAARPLMSSCADPVDGYIVCGNFYSAADPIWQLMGVASPGAGPGAPPAGCANDLGEGAIMRITTGSCGGYWSGMDAWSASLPAHHAALDAAITAFNNDLAARTVNNWYELAVTGQTVSETAVTSSRPGQVLAGGNMTLAGGTNHDSIIVAGGNLEGGALQNLATKGQRQATQEGTQVYSWGDHDGGLFGSGYRRNRSEPQPIASAPTVTSFDLPLVRLLAGTPPASVVAPASLPPAAAPGGEPGTPHSPDQPVLPGSLIAAPERARQQGTSAAPPGAALAAIAAAAPQPRAAPAPVKAEGYLTVTSQGVVRVPGSQLFALNRAPGARYALRRRGQGRMRARCRR